MKNGFCCPKCGKRELTNWFITTHKGRSLSLLLASQVDIRKSSGEVYCIECKQARRITDLQIKQQLKYAEYLKNTKGTSSATA